MINYLSKTFGVHVTGINLSTEHLKFGRERFEKNNPNMKLIYGDFAEISKLNEKFDRIVSVGFYEHVGHDRYDEFYKVMYDNLKDDGIALLHTIGSNNGNKSTDEWILKYIFTRGQIPSIENISTHAQNNGFVFEDLQNFGVYYGLTLHAWHERFKKAMKCKTDKDYVFYRMFSYYLASCEAAFMARQLFLWQIVFTKQKHITVYTGER